LEINPILPGEEPTSIPLPIEQNLQSIPSSSQTNSDPNPDPDKDIKSEILDILKELEHAIGQAEKYKNPNEADKTADNSPIVVEYSSINVQRDEDNDEEVPEETNKRKEEIVLV
jgi:hypothetical protein